MKLSMAKIMGVKSNPKQVTVNDKVTDFKYHHDHKVSHQNNDVSTGNVETFIMFFFVFVCLLEALCDPFICPLVYSDNSVL